MSVVPDQYTHVVLPAVADRERLAAMRDTGLLDRADETLDRIARLAAALVRAPRAYVTMVTPERQHLPGMVRLDDPGDTGRETPLNASLCQFTVATGEPLVIPDSHRDPLVEHLLPVRDGEVGAYAGVPLRSSGGHVLGTLCVLDSVPRDWAEDELALLEDLSVLATEEMERRLTGAQEQRLLGVAQQVVHRLPLLTDALHSLVDLAERADDQRLQRYAALTRARMSPLTAVVEQVQQSSVEQAAQAVRGPLHSDLRRSVQRAVEAARAATGSDLVEFAVPGRPLLTRCDGAAVEQAVAHLFVTALHHSTGRSPVVVGLEQTTAAAHRAEAGPATARLTVVARDSRVPAGELARVVSRFSAAGGCAGDPDGDDAGPAALRVVGGAVSAESGRVQGRSSGDGLVLTARWPLAAD